MERLKKYLSCTILIGTLILILVISTGDWIVNAGNDGKSLEDYTNPKKTYYDTNYYDADHLFGAAGHFHLFASNQIALKAHCNGNFAVPSIDIGAACGTNQVVTIGEREMSYADKMKYNSLEIATADLALGKSNTTVTDKNGPLAVGPISENQIYINGAQMNIKDYQKIYLAPDKFIDFTKEFAHLREVSAALTKLEPTLKKGEKSNANQAGTYNLEDHNNAYIYLSDGVNIVNCTISEISANSGKLDIKGMLCNKNSDASKHSFIDSQSLIINVDCKGTTTASPSLETKYSCQCTNGWPHGHGEENYYPGTIVIWNFYDSSKADKLYTGKLTPTNTIDGCYLVPNGDIAPSSNTNGTLIGKNITITAESHRADFKGKKPKLNLTTSPSAKPTASPTVKPSTKPSAKPTASPTVKPSTKPSANPSNKPAETASPTNAPTTPNDTEAPATQAPKETPQPTAPNETATPSSPVASEAAPTASPKGDTKNPKTPSDKNNKKTPKKGNLIITVTDSQTGAVVPDATVKITKPNGEVENYTTDKNGQIKLKKTAVGKYNGVVTKVPKGYHADRTKFDSKVKAATTTKEKVKIKTAVKASRKTNTNSKVSSNTATNTSQPKTGDSFDVRIPIVLFLLAFAGIIIAIILKKRAYYYYN